MGKLKVFELKLDSHGVPLTGGKVSLILCTYAEIYQYIRLPSPFEPYVLRFNLQGASGVCREGKFLTNYPFEGYIFSSLAISEHSVDKTSTEPSSARSRSILLVFPANLPD